jgi:hypothetical protein
MPRPRILFLGPSHDLDDVRAALGAEARWDLAFCVTASEATADMAGHPADIVVVGASRQAWLETARDRWPRALRMVLCGPQELKGIIATLALAHQCLRNPCDPLILRTALEQGLILLELLDDPDTRGAVGTLDSLPTLPKAYWRMVEAMNDPTLGVNDIAGIVEVDPTLSSKMLEMVNSAFFAPEYPITSVRQAVGFLGPELTAGMALSSAIARALRGELTELKRLALSRPLARFATPANLEAAGTPTLEGHALASSLIHDIGLILFSLYIPAPGLDAYLAGIWACPD